MIRRIISRSQRKLGGAAVKHVRPPKYLRWCRLCPLENKNLCLQGRVCKSFLEKASRDTAVQRVVEYVVGLEKARF